MCVFFLIFWFGGGLRVVSRFGALAWGPDQVCILIVSCGARWGVEVGQSCFEHSVCAGWRMSIMFFGYHIMLQIVLSWW